MKGNGILLGKYPMKIPFDEREGVLGAVILAL
jgi:hypothetical protein